MDIAELIRRVKRFGLENLFRRYYSEYPAQVTNNEDPEGLWRVRVIVPDVADDLELPVWAEPKINYAGKDPDVNSSTNGSFLSFTPPKVGDFVWVKFRMGDRRKPVYSGGWLAKNEAPGFLTDDKKNAIFISRYGHKITVDEDENNANITLEMDDTTKFTLNQGTKTVQLIDANGDEWKWDYENGEWNVVFDGNKEVNISGTLTEIIESAVTKQFQDNMTVEVGGDGEIILNGKVIIQAGQNASFWGAALTNLGAESGTFSVPLGELLLQALNLNVLLYSIHQHPSSIPLTGQPTTTQLNISSSVLSQKVKLV